MLSSCFASRADRAPSAQLSSIPFTIDSITSKTKRLTLVKTRMANIPRIPQDIIDEILDHLGTDLDIESLRPYALVSKSWVQSCRRRLFYDVFFDSRKMDRWLKIFPVPEESPANHVRDLGFWIRGAYSIPEQFLDYIPWFPNVEVISLLGPGGPPLLRTPSFWRPPLSVTSLTISADAVTLMQVCSIMAQLPNLDNLSLSGSLIADDGGIFMETGTILRGRFRGRLLLRWGYADGSLMDMLLGIPTQLHFTEVDIHGAHNCLLSTMRLVDACCKTLVKLSLIISHHSKSYLFSLSSWFWRVTDATSQLRWPRGPRAVVRFFQLPEPPKSGV